MVYFTYEMLCCINHGRSECIRLYLTETHQTKHEELLLLLIGGNWKSIIVHLVFFPFVNDENVNLI